MVIELKDQTTDLDKPQKGPVTEEHLLIRLLIMPSTPEILTGYLYLTSGNSGSITGIRRVINVSVLPVMIYWIKITLKTLC